MAEESLKHDAGKPPLALLDPAMLLGVARVLEFGAKKYEAWNWAKGTFAWSRLISAAQRHILAFQAGEEFDDESGLPHIDHALCCLMFLRRYASDRLGTDDRHQFPVDTLKHETPYFRTPIKTEYSLSRSELSPDHAGGRGPGGGGGTAGDPLRWEFGERTREDAERCRTVAGSDLPNERPLDPAAEQQAGSLPTPGKGVESAAVIRVTDAELAAIRAWRLVTNTNSQVPWDTLSPSKLLARGLATLAGGGGGAPERDRNPGQHSPVGADGADGDQQVSGDSDVLTINTFEQNGRHWRQP